MSMAAWQPFPLTLTLLIGFLISLDHRGNGTLTAVPLAPVLAAVPAVSVISVVSGECGECSECGAHGEYGGCGIILMHCTILRAAHSTTPAARAFINWHL